MELKISIFIIYEDSDGVRVWSARKKDYLTLKEWYDLVESINLRKFCEERGGKSDKEGTV